STPRSDDREVLFLAYVALADVLLLPECGLDLLADRLAVGLQGLQDLAEHLLGLPDDVLARPDAGRNALHVRLEVGRHLRLRDPFGMVFEGLDHRPPARRGPRVLPFDELAIVEFLEDVVPVDLVPRPSRSISWMRDPSLYRAGGFVRSSRTVTSPTRSSDSPAISTGKFVSRTVQYG